MANQTSLGAVPQTSLTKVNFTFAKGKNFTNKTGRFEKSNRPIYFFVWVWYNKLSYIQEDIKMLVFKKKKIQVYLNNLSDSKTTFDLLLCDYLDGSIKKDLETIGFEKNKYTYRLA